MAQAKAVVTKWLGLCPQHLGVYLPQKIRKIQTFTGSNGAPVYYVVYLDPTGIVFMPADDLVKPIIGFLPDASSYDPSSDNPLGALVNQDIPRRVQKARAVEAKAAAEGKTPLAASPQSAAQRKWEFLENNTGVQPTADFGSSLTSISDVRVAAFVQSDWDQSTVNGAACFNYYTPPYAAGDPSNYVCGCVATAMAQVMRYFQYPITGVGTASYQYTVDGTSETGPLRGGDGNGGPYNWADMILDPFSPGANQTQCQAIGDLTHDVGLSVNTNYAAGGSGAWVIPSAFTDTFGYGNADDAFPNSDTVRNDIIESNLDAGYPVLLGIESSSGAEHEVVTDGYGYDLSTLYNHLNLGWGGYDNGWYNLPNIDAGGYDFNTIEDIAYNIFPSGTGEIISGRVTDASGAPVSGATVSAVRASGGSYSATSNANGIYALAKIPSSSTYTISVTKTGYTFPTREVTIGTSDTYDGSTTGDRWGINFEDGTTSTTVASSLDPSVFGQTLTFTATVSPDSATGTVTFYDGANSLGTGTLSGGVASLNTSALSVGSHSITAVYGGDSNYTGSTSSAISQTVQQGGALSVSITPTGAVLAGAEWRVDSGSWQESGATVSNLSVGQHTIFFNDISGWTQPSSQTVSVTAGQTTSVTGTYVQALNGACGGSSGGTFASAPISNLCGSGTASPVTGGTSTWNWTCSGQNGGTNASCSANRIVNGACGSSNGESFTSAPSSNLCSSGTASSVSGSGPWNWTCQGTNGGTNASCSANVQPVNGACGSSNGGTFTSAPKSNLCSAGTASTVTGTGPWNWTCSGQNGGKNASCSASLKVNGACGSANGQAFLTAPTSNLCSSGTASSVSGSGPWSWACAGQNGGTNASCSAKIEVNGACGSSNGASFTSAPTSNLCISGTASSVSGSGPWSWTCQGTNGRTDVSCSANVSSTGGLWQNATSTGGGWYNLSPFGTFNTNSSPWIYHQTLGWLYPVGTSMDSLWFYDPQWDGTGGWWWTSSSLFPWIYSATEQTWLYFDAGDSNPGTRWFFTSGGQASTH